MVSVFGYYFFFLSVFNIVGDELDKLGVKFFEGGVLMDYKLFFDFVIVFKKYRGYIVKGISNIFIYVKFDVLYRSWFVLYLKCLYDKFYYVYCFVKVWCI